MEEKAAPQPGEAVVHKKNEKKKRSIRDSNPEPSDSTAYNISSRMLCH